MSLVVVRLPRYGLTYGSVRPVSSVPGPMTATGLTGRSGSIFYAFTQSALRAFLLFDAAGLFCERQGSCRSRCSCSLAWAPTAFLILLYGIWLARFFVGSEPPSRVVNTASLSC